MEQAIKPDLRVGFVLVEQFTLAPVAGLVESLRFAADESFRSLQIYCQWDWMTQDNQAVTASCGMQVVPTQSFNLFNGYDYIVLASGLLGPARHPKPELLQALQAAYAAKIPIIALDSACFILGLAGLLDGKQCAIHFTTIAEFKALFPKVQVFSDRMYVNDHNIITCPGGTAIDLAAFLIRQHCGEKRAKKSLEYLLVDEEEGVNVAAAATGDAPIYANKMVLKAIAYMQANLDSHAQLKDVAEHIGTYPRHLHRLFVMNTQETPAGYWRKLRLEHGRKLLANTNVYITNIAIECGFADVSHFILWFRKVYGETPRAYRKRRHKADHFISAAHAEERGLVSNDED